MDKRSSIKKSLFEHWKIISLYLIIYKIIAVNAAYMVALLLRFDFVYSRIPDFYIKAYIQFAPIYTLFCIFLYFTRVFGVMQVFRCCFGGPLIDRLIMS